MAKDPILDRVLLQLNPSDALTFRDLTAGGCLTLGEWGSGKSSTVGAMAARSFLSGGYCGVTVIVKSDEPDQWRNRIREAGRERDLIEFGPDLSTSDAVRLPTDFATEQKNPADDPQHN